MGIRSRRERSKRAGKKWGDVEGEFRAACDEPLQRLQGNVERFNALWKMMLANFAFFIIARSVFIIFKTFGNFDVDVMVFHALTILLEYNNKYLIISTSTICTSRYLLLYSRTRRVSLIILILIIIYLSSSPFAGCGVAGGAGSRERTVAKVIIIRAERAVFLQLSGINAFFYCVGANFVVASARRNN